MHKFFRVSSLAALALGAIALTAQAQGAKSFGVLAGVDFASISGSDFDGTGSKTGFMGGFYFAIPVAARMAIEPEVLYANKGATDDANSDLKLTNAYVEIPVLFKYNFNDAGGPYLLVGPTVGFSIDCSLHDSTDSVDCSDIGLDTKTTFGGVVGLGYMKNRFGLEGRYDFDFGEAFDNSNGKNAAWAVLARIMIK
jgi:hypothetical protein